MSTWTTPARERLDDYLNGSRQRAAATGADADEVAADLRHHVEEEVAALKLPVVTEHDVQRIIARTGALPETEPREEPRPAPNGSRVKRAIAPACSGSLFFFGVLLPIATLAIELATHICAGTFFDPLPTWLHVILVATIPAANAVAWFLLRNTGQSVPRWLWWLNGMALGTAIFYTVIYLPMSPFACIGVLFLGFGLLPLSPLCSLICTLRLGSHLRRRSAERSEQKPRHWWGIAFVPLAFLMLFALHAPLTRHWIDMAGSESSEDSMHAIRMLRQWGSEDVILKEAYGRADRLDTELFDSRRPNTVLAQKVFYRVTGKAFNAVPPPLSKYQRSARDLFNEFEWDNGLGGETVAGQVKGLSLQQSRMDGLCEPDEGWAYLQWTCEFRNDHEWSQREARAQVLLPPGGVVSRVTLWVNGEPREAAFAGRGEVRAAYQQVAVQQRRDPILVTMSGPDRVLVQCFPIQPRGGTMKIRLGITAPLLMEKTNETALRLPCMVERNFKVSSQFEHSFWLESPRGARAEFTKFHVDTVKGKNGVRGQIPESRLANHDAVLRFAAAAPFAPVRAADPKNAQRVIVQTLARQEPQLPGRVAIVLDGSGDMTEAFPQVARALDGLPSTEVAIWLAQDGEQQVFSSDWQNGATASRAVGRLRGVGGQDDLPALLQAWEWSAAQPRGVLLWIHGAQPVLMNGIEALKQRLDWRSGPDAPAIIDVAVRAGPNRIAEQFATASAFSALPRTGRLQDDLERLFATWTGREPQFGFRRTEEKPGPGEAPKASAHIVRLWAAEQIRELAKARRVTEAVNLAAEQQLVTTVSGAVVLETKQQFQAAGLTPVDPASVPTIPEPGVWAVLALGFAMFTWFGTRRSRT
jgi:hypothetical protein